MNNETQAINPCQHINGKNQCDCEEEAEYMCMCCGTPVCEEHNSGRCPFGGMGFIDI